MKIETLAVHAGHRPDPATGAVASPIYLSTTFEREADGSYPHGYEYVRENNPNRENLEVAMTELEGGASAIAFSSGMAATLSIFQALAPGDHVIAPDDAYFGMRALLRDTFVPWGLQVTFLDMTDLAQVQAAVRPNTRLIFVETPSNPLLKVTDLAGVAEIARKAGAFSVCDNTWATSLLQRPLELGFGLVMHATTKYLGGHSDVMGGVLVAKEESEYLEKLRKLQRIGGVIPSPFDCWLVLRGIRTLPCRVRVHSENALKVATFLSQHPGVELVHYPGLETHPGYAVAKRQMKSFGGMLSVQIKGGRERAMAVAAKVKVFTRATSLGGVESLLEHRASIEGPGTRTPDNLLRMSIGLEHSDDLIEDLAQALED